MKLASNPEIYLQSENQQIAITKALEAKDTRALLTYWEYFVVSENNSKPNTVEAYLIDVKGFLVEYALLNELDLLDVTRQEASEYKNQLTNLYSPATVQRKLTSTRQFFEMLRHHQIIEFNPFAGVKGRKQVKVVNKIG